MYCDKLHFPISIFTVSTHSTVWQKCLPKWSTHLFHHEVEWCQYAGCSATVPLHPRHLCLQWWGGRDMQSYIRPVIQHRVFWAVIIQMDRMPPPPQFPTIYTNWWTETSCMRCGLVVMSLMLHSWNTHCQWGLLNSPAISQVSCCELFREFNMSQCLQACNWLQE